MNTIACQVCRKEISPRASVCPSCGEPQGEESKGGRFLDFMTRVNPVVMPALLALVGGLFTLFQYQKDRDWLEQEALKNEATAKADRAVQLLEYLVSDHEEEQSLSVFLSLTFASQNQLSDGVIPILARASEKKPELKDALKDALLRLRLDEDGKKSGNSNTKLAEQVDIAISSLFERESVHYWQRRRGSPEEQVEAFEQLLLPMGSIGTKVEKTRMLKALEESLEMINLLDSIAMMKGQRSDKAVEAALDNKAKHLQALGQKVETLRRNPAANSLDRSAMMERVLPLVSEKELRIIFEAAGLQFERLAIVYSEDEQEGLARKVEAALKPVIAIKGDLENIKGTTTGIPIVHEIRYREASPEEEDGGENREKAAKSVQERLRSKLNLEFKLEPKPKNIISEREIEIWLAKPDQE